LSRSDFDFEFMEIFIIKKWLADSVSQGVAIQNLLNWSAIYRTLKAKPAL
jgi:hypothetical protein